MLNRVTGTEDILDCSLQNFVFNTLQKSFETSHFTHIQTPILEYTQLFTHSLGNQTDVVSKEMYIVQQDSEKSICLRPEATASTIRACLENKIDRFPWKVFSFGPMFRRERPQKGRLRQFTQFNIEIISAPSIMHDALFITKLNTIFSELFKFKNYYLKLNFLGCFNDRQQHKQHLFDFLKKQEPNLCATCVTRTTTNTLRVFDCKNESCKKIYTKAPLLISYLCATCNEEWVLLQNTLHTMSVAFTIDATLVRGLDYYCKTVFEFTATTTLGSQNAFCGGGRYRLGTELGAPQDLDCVGAGIGIERILMILEEEKPLLAMSLPPALTVIIPVTKEQDNLGLLVIQDLTQKGLCCDIILEKASMSNMLKKANKMNATYVIIIGEQEQKDGTASVKNMITGNSEIVKQTDLTNYLL